MRLIRSTGQNVSPSDDGRLFDQIFTDGLFADTTFAMLGANNVQIGTIYGDLCGRDFTIEQQTVAVALPEGEGETNGYIFVEIDTSAETPLSVGSALAPFTPTYEDVNVNGAVAQMIIAEYTASAVAVTSITAKYSRVSAGGIGSLAMIESSPATANHSAGSYLVYDGVLYKVRSAIAAGETLVPGTNITATTAGAELTSLNTGLTRNKKGTDVDLSDRTTDYTFPTDGYLVVSAGSSASAIAIAELRDSNAAYIGTIGGQGNSAYPSWITFVRAGMIARTRTVRNSGYVSFVPLVS